MCDDLLMFIWAARHFLSYLMINLSAMFHFYLRDGLELPIIGFETMCKVVEKDL